MTAADLHLPPLDNPTVWNQGTVTFIGTATVLVRYGALTFLTDPNFLHAGDHAHLGYGLRSERLTNPALELAELPPLDFVLLSHHHGDHFDHLVERDLDRTIPIITEPGSAKKLQKLGFQSTYPLARWESMTVRRGLQWLSVTAMPARHAPGPIASLLPSVMGSMLRFGHGDGDAGFHLYITGDTLLVDELAEIGRRHPDIDLCMLHLGGTRIAGILLTMDAEQGVRLLELLGPKTAIPIHYDDYTVFKSPLGDFLDLANRSQLSTRIVTLDRGGTYRFDIPHDDSLEDRSFAKVFNTFIEHDGHEWAVCIRADGQRRVVSRHATAQLARRAERELNESANRSVEESNEPR
jgi:L-ascorbate metabolism protein UlaG (beta-lactamase superfamily)